MDASLFTTLAGAPTTAVHAGVSVNSDTALRAIPVFAAANIIADAIAAMPVSAMRRTPDGAREQVERQPLWLEQPNPETLWVDFIHRVLESVLVPGTTFIDIEGRDRLGHPAEVWTLSPQDMRPTRAAGRLQWINPRLGRVFSPYSRLQQEGDIVVMKGWQGAGDWGLSPVDVARQAIGLTLALERHGGRLFGKGAEPAGVVEYENTPTKETLDLMRDEWTKHHAGDNRAQRVGFVFGGRWRGTTMTNDQSQFLESRRFQRSEIAMLYRVPPHLLSDVTGTTSWGTGIFEQNLGFLTYTLLPWIRRLEAHLSQLLPRGQFVHFNFDGLLRAKQEDRFKAYAQGIQWGWLSVNDVRRLEDQPPVPGGDTYLRPLNMVEAGKDPSPAQQRALGAGVPWAHPDGLPEDHHQAA